MANVITFDNQKVEPVSPVRVLPGIQLDDKLSFNLHDSNICQSARNCLQKQTGDMSWVNKP